MGNWSDVLNEIRGAGTTHDLVRRRYLRELAELRNRNVIAYYSGWLQKPHLQDTTANDVGLNDADMNGFMSAIHGLDRDKGLDLLLHTPGGEMSATESLVSYLRSTFGTNIVAFVPQIAMSAGTMVACACREIWMGKESSLGPTDPQIGGLPAAAILEEFERAAAEIRNDSTRALVWQPILSKLEPSAITQSGDVIAWGKEVVTRWLETGMFAGENNAALKAKGTVDKLTSKELNRAHSRHLNAETAIEYGLNVQMLESNQALQDAVLTVHHAFTITLDTTPACKIIENHTGAAFIHNQQVLPIVS